MNKKLFTSYLCDESDISYKILNEWKELNLIMKCYTFQIQM